MNHNDDAHFEVLVTTQWVADHLEDPYLRFVEVDGDATAYASGHIPGAVAWHWQRDTQERFVRDISKKADFEALISHCGVASDTTVVLYGDYDNWFAAFAFWLLKMHGHREVRLIDGGRRRWLDEGRPISTDVPRSGATLYEAQPPNLISAA